MLRTLPVLIGCAAVAVACSGPTGPTGSGRLLRLSRTRFVAFGDSLTAGEVTAAIGAVAGVFQDPGPKTQDLVSKHTIVPAASYPTQLHALLDARYPSQASEISVANAGLGGESIFRGVLRFEEALSANSADAVIIMHGLNNLGVDGVDVPTILMRDMVRTAKERRVSVFVASMLPTIAGRQRSQNAPLLEAYNAKLRQMTVEEGVRFVDLYTELSPQAQTVIGIDGLHPTEAGYRRMAEVFFAAVRSALEEEK